MDTPSHKHPDFDLLLNTLLPFAELCLKKQGTFLPFAAVVTFDGKIELVAGDPGEEKPGAHKVLDLLTEGLRTRAQANKFRAVGVCADAVFARTPTDAKRDAISVFLEHQEGNVVIVYRPYSKGWFGKISYDDLAALPAERKIFAAA